MLKFRFQKKTSLINKCQQSLKALMYLFSKDDQLSQQLPTIPRGSNVFIIKTAAYLDIFDEERKESQQSEDRFIN